MIRTALAVGALATGAALFAPAAATAAATPTAPDLSVRVGTARLQPVLTGGYRGNLPVRITSHANTTDRSLTARIAVPRGLTMTFTAESTIAQCTGTGTADEFLCRVTVPLADGETLDTSIGLSALSAPARRDRVTAPGRVTVLPDGQAGVDPTPAGNTGTFRAVLDGTGRGVTRYRPATSADMALTVDDAYFSANADGSYTGFARATVTANADAPHDSLRISQVTSFEGLESVTTMPAAPCFGWAANAFCAVPDGALPQATQRSFTLVFQSTALPAAGSTFVLAVSTDGVAESNPADNTATVTVRHA